MRTELPCFVARLRVLYEPFVYKLKAARSHNIEMCVAVVERIVRNEPILGTVVFIRIVKHIRKIGSVLRIIFTRKGKIVLKAHIIVVAHAEHYGNALGNALEAFHESRPLDIRLTAVRVVARGENELAFGVSVKQISHCLAHRSVIRRRLGTARLDIGKAQK